MDPITLSLSDIKYIDEIHYAWYYVSENPALYESMNALRKKEVDAMVKYHNKQTSRTKKNKGI